MASKGALITLPGIAELARVQRPVVSMWRRRPMVGGHEVPFPSPVTVAGVEHFSVDDVVEWLESTGRGNNPDPRADAMAHALLPDVAATGVDALDAIAAMLCLTASTERRLIHLDDADIVDLADDVDPDDDMLFREIDALGPDRRRVADYVDRLVDAAYHAAGALDRVLIRYRRAGIDDAGVLLAESAHQLVGEVSAALASDLESPAMTIIDATGGGSDLAGAVMTAFGERIDGSLAIRGDGDGARRALRMARIRGWAVAADQAAEGPAIVVGQFPNQTTPDLSARQILAAIDQIRERLESDHRAVIVGPADVLCDSLRDHAPELRRDALVRDGWLRCALRLPRGLMPRRPRQRLGLWVLGPRDDTQPEKRRTLVADVVDTELTPSMIDDLVSDVVATVSRDSVTAAHRFRRARWMPTPLLLAGRATALVPTGSGRAPTTAHASSAEHWLSTTDIMAKLAATRPDTANSISAEPTDVVDPVRTVTTLASAVAQKAVRVLAGSVVDEAALSDGTVRLVRPVDLEPTSGAEPRYVDALELEAQYPRARRTEPGDVIYCTTPRPRAVVDAAGMSVVVRPARVLRCDAARGLSPDVVAWTINAQLPGARDWRSWQVPVIPDDAVDEVAHALRSIDADAAAARRRIRLLDLLAARLVDGAATGTLSIQIDPTSTKSTADTQKGR